MVRLPTQSCFLRLSSSVLLLLSATAAHAQLQLPNGAAQPQEEKLPFPDIPAPTLPAEAPPFWIFMSGGIALLLLAVFLIWLLFRPSSGARKPPAPPLPEALKKLQELRTHLADLPPPEVAHRVSVILRVYQQRRYAVPAPYRTSEELYRSVSASLKAGVQERFGPLAEVYDRIAFAPLPTTPDDASRLIDAAQSALEKESANPVVMPPPLPPSYTSSQAPRLS